MDIAKTRSTMRNSKVKNGEVNQDATTESHLGGEINNNARLDSKASFRVMLVMFTGLVGN